MAKMNTNKSKDGNWFDRHKLLTGILGVIILFSLVGNSDSQDQNTTGQTNAEHENTDKVATSQAAAEPEDPNPHFKDGTYIVGEEIEPGTYRTRNGSSGCYYSRLAGFSGTLKDIISNANTNYPAVITIDPGDKGFESTRCGTWTQNLSQITKDKTSIGDGIYIVGSDIEPGTYKNSGSDNCYFARLSGFSGTMGDIIANNNSDNTAIVTISPSDKGFESTRCGNWSKIE